MTIFKILKIKGLFVDYVRVIYTLCSYGKSDCYVNQSVLKVSDDNLLI